MQRINRSLAHWAVPVSYTHLLDDRHASCKRTEQLVADRPGSGRHFVGGQALAPEHDRGIDTGVRQLGQIAGQHVHRYTPKGFGALTGNQNGRATRCMARVAVRIATGDDPRPGGSPGLEQPAVTDPLTRPDLLDLSLIHI